MPRSSDVITRECFSMRLNFMRSLALVRILSNLMSTHIMAPREVGHSLQLAISTEENLLITLRQRKTHINFKTVVI